MWSTLLNFTFYTPELELLFSKDSQIARFEFQLGREIGHDCLYWISRTYSGWPFVHTSASSVSGREFFERPSNSDHTLISCHWFHPLSKKRNILYQMTAGFKPGPMTIKFSTLQITISKLLVHFTMRIQKTLRQLTPHYCLQNPNYKRVTFIYVLHTVLVWIICFSAGKKYYILKFL